MKRIGAMGRKLGEVFLKIPPLYAALVAVGAAFVFGFGAGTTTVNALSVPARVEALERTDSVHLVALNRMGRHIVADSIQTAAILCILEAIVNDRDLGPFDCPRPR
jgi:hypothetical protein